MTKNAYLFMWDYSGIEAIVPITQFEKHDEVNTCKILKGEPIEKNPINGIIHIMMLRARFNPERRYEIYTIDCSEEYTEELWKELWEEDPQGWADTIREKGVKIWGVHGAAKDVKIK